MNEEMIAALAERLGPLGERAWELAIRAELIEAWCWGSFLALSLLSWFIIGIIRRYKITEFDEIGPMYMSVMLVLGVLTFLATIGLFVEVIPVLIDPEAAAFKSIINR